MHSLMNNPNNHHLERLNLRFRCAVFDKSDEEEILNHWHFKFPHLRSLSLKTYLHIDISIISILYHRIVKNCPKLNSFFFINSQYKTETYYYGTEMNALRNQFKYNI